MNFGGGLLAGAAHVQFLLFRAFFSVLFLFLFCRLAPCLARPSTGNTTVYLPQPAAKSRVQVP